MSIGMKSLCQTIVCFFIFLVLSKANICEGRPEISEFHLAGVDSLDSVFFDLREAVCTGPFISVPVRVKSDDEVFAVDFAIKLNIDEITFHSIQQVKPYLFQAANFNAGDSTLRFTSFSLFPVENDSDLFWVRFNKNDGYVNALDFTNATAQLNGDFCPYTIIDTDPAPYLSVPPTISIVPGDSVQVLVNAVAGSSFIWTNGDTTASVFIDTSGSFGVTIFSPGSGCSSVLNLTVNFAIPLPVEFGDIRVERINRNAIISWNTFTETGNDYFVIERSADGVSWSDIGHVDGAGFSVIPITYSFIDQDVPSSGMYYKIRQTDFNGDYSYSPISFLEPDRIDSARRLKVFPNPSTHHFTVQLPEGSDYTAMQLISFTGEVLFESPVLLANDWNLVVHWPNKMKPGIYFVRFTSAGGQETVPVFLADGKN